MAAGGSNEDDYLSTCGICFIKYDFLMYRPKVLPCSHTYFFTCIQKLKSDLARSKAELLAERANHNILIEEMLNPKVRQGDHDQYKIKNQRDHSMSSSTVETVDLKALVADESSFSDDGMGDEGETKWSSETVDSQSKDKVSDDESNIEESCYISTGFVRLQLSEKVNNQSMDEESEPESNIEESSEDSTIIVSEKVTPKKNIGERAVDGLDEEKKIDE
ncbi:hypothetical protein DAPPUDRAFT_322852 [Daphnia pulex]|uniref:Uncharacterized protein n=1 Tax=Daphnia pulex TaxID=6669 RepID=E9GX45_DAPPU|nr:hypothetical protein DAPPUDRAFT_322852 [Daphnia pulex]|eukprot:EFX75926.1 hypothetical protein DAPPUDRAFT_322852 [Daphnia pulex]